MERVTTRLPAAVLWDMDGTLVHTEPLWVETERSLVERNGREWTEDDSRALVGADLLAAGAYIRDRGELAMTPEQVVEHMVAEMLTKLADGVAWLPGVVELLTELRELDVPCALVTMAYRSLADAVASLLPPGTFAAVVPGDEVTHGKPHPEPYLTAAARLNVDPADCIVIEDSPTGAASGLAAGARVVSVPNVVATEPRPGMVVIDSLAGLAPADLLALFELEDSSLSRDRA